jgi:hypothetical protein
MSFAFVCQGANHLKSSNRVFNVDAHETPKILEADYIDLSQIISISRFRSSEGRLLGQFRILPEHEALL